VENPIGIKVGPSANFTEICEVIKVLNPKNEDGKIIIIVRMGYDKIAQKLPDLLNELRKQNIKAILQSDPMHGNIIKSNNNFKTRKFEDILGEIELFFKITKQNNFYPGGIHLEMTGDDVTECTGGFENITEIDLEKRYHTHCDPRLNSNQSIELAFLICNQFKTSIE
jgi:3-deoxy-7-phosphoheptulonate synthase